jgi:hypothetical protein
MRLAAVLVTVVVLALLTACSSASTCGGLGCDVSITCIMESTPTTCVETDSADPSFSCSTEKGMSGYCPAAKLVGCCAIEPASGAYETLDITCSYEGVSSSASELENTCASNDGSWTTYVPGLPPP